MDKRIYWFIKFTKQPIDMIDELDQKIINQPPQKSFSIIVSSSPPRKLKVLWEAVNLKLNATDQPNDLLFISQTRIFSLSVF